MKYWQIAIASPLRQLFDYLPPESSPALVPTPGMRVRVPFGRRSMIGIVVRTTTHSQIDPAKLKPILEVLDETALLPASLFKFFQTLSDYYQYPLGEVLHTALPTKLRQGKPAEIKRAKPYVLNPTIEEALHLNDEQALALEVINDSFGQFKPILLDGVTGSGKTEVYLQAITQCLLQKKHVLVLVPEINLTPQTIERFAKRFQVHIGVLHSQLNETQRLNAWLKIKQGEVPIVIGTRSAIFVPIPQLGLLIVDEEHDRSFKQQDSFRYCARDVAIWRAFYEKIPVVLGSATPSLESLHNAQQSRYQHLRLTQRAGDAKPAQVRLVDIRQGTLNNGLSAPVIEAISHRLKKQQQVLIFLNRRGFAPVLMCHACGWMADCHACSVRLTLHQKKKQLHCHYCEKIERIPVQCPQCTSTELHTLGQGTERVEEALTQLFPDATIARMDRDTIKKAKDLDAILADILSQKCHILLGTQMIAKGHHFPHVTLAVIVEADAGLFSIDFRAQEHFSQLLLQVAGRSGRAHLKGEVLIQTRQPEHAIWQDLLSQDYTAIAKNLLQQRQMAQLPPFGFLALLRTQSKQADQGIAFLMQAKQLLQKSIAHYGHAIQVLGPIPAPIEKIAGKYRYQLLLKATQRKALQTVLQTSMPLICQTKTNAGLQWSLDVDPIDMR